MREQEVQKELEKSTFQITERFKSKFYKKIINQQM